MTVLAKMGIKHYFTPHRYIQWPKMVPKPVEEAGKNLKFFSDAFEARRWNNVVNYSLSIFPIPPRYMFWVAAAAVILPIIFPIYHQADR